MRSFPGSSPNVTLGNPFGGEVPRLEELVHEEIETLAESLFGEGLFELEKWIRDWGSDPLSDDLVELIREKALSLNLSRAAEAVVQHAKLASEKPKAKFYNHVEGDVRVRAEACLASLRTLLKTEKKRGAFGPDLSCIKGHIASLEGVLKYASFGGKVPWPVSEPSLSCFRKHDIEHLIHDPWDIEELKERARRNIELIRNREVE